MPEKREELADSVEAKVILLGDVAVGKSSLATNFYDGTFDAHHTTTLGAAFLARSIISSDNVKISFNVWDTAGEERFRSISRLYCRDADAIIFVYDITSEASFEAARELMADTHEKVVIALVGNKMDLEENRQVETEAGKGLARMNNYIFMETSAKNGTNVTELFRIIGSKLPRVRPKPHPGRFRVGSRSLSDDSWTSSCPC